MAIILVVDDEAPLLRVLSRYLTGLGHHVLSAGNGADALTILRDGAVDLLVTDINMPEVDGIEIIRALAASGRSIPAIAMSGGGAIDAGLLLGSAGLLGAVETLEKPFELTALREAVERVLA